MVTRHLLDHPTVKAEVGHGGGVTLIQRFGSAANLNIHLQLLVLDGLITATPMARQSSSRRQSPPMTSSTRCCRPSLPGS